MSTFSGQKKGRTNHGKNIWSIGNSPGWLSKGSHTQKLKEVGDTSEPETQCHTFVTRIKDSENSFC